MMSDQLGLKELEINCKSQTRKWCHDSWNQRGFLGISGIKSGLRGYSRFSSTNQGFEPKLVQQNLLYKCKPKRHRLSQSQSVSQRLDRFNYKPMGRKGKTTDIEDQDEEEIPVQIFVY